MQDDRVIALTMIANGDERLRWGNDHFNLVTESATKHLMAGHPIDLNNRVRYGLVAGPAVDNEIVSR